MPLAKRLKSSLSWYSDDLVLRYTDKTIGKFADQATDIKRSAAEIIQRERKKKRSRKSAAEQKKGYEHVTKDVPENMRLSDKELLALGNDTSITHKDRWVQVPYACNYKGVLFEPCFKLVLDLG